ncbi:hypothetical protein TWF481_004814 [Arthrobotrys musiformis]|uniref:Uncharacterized protein n=1 Tax=Arthrobotrys musiformis TaxID=47236 RepID=A0AAV9WKP1_9PEZI
MTRPVEPLHPSHPAHIIHHKSCNHILRRIYLPCPTDPSSTGCICPNPPEEIVKPICLERGGIPCRIDELSYELVSLPVECNYCAESPGRGSEGGSESEHVVNTNEAGNGKGERRRRRKGKGRSGGRVSKRVSIAQTPATKLAMGFGGLGIQSPSSISSGSDSATKKGKRGSKKKSKESNEESVEEKVWKHLRSGPVGAF